MTFQTETFGKWILAGEHAVLRGVPALVLPVKQFSMKFNYDQKSSEPLCTQFAGPSGSELQLIFWALIESALLRLGRSRADLSGNLSVESSLPLGAGLGASAALCVGISRIFNYLGWLEEKNIYEFSRQMENVFHGESSGVDIAIAMEARGLRFMRGGERSALSVNWTPQLYLSYSGKRGMTSDCVRRVNDMRAQNPQVGNKIDAQMRDAVELAEKSLALDEANGFDFLAQALDMARDCFYQWGLCEGALDQHLKELSRDGAYALKPTGSGGGGYVLSLWKSDPPADLKNQLIPLF